MGMHNPPHPGEFITEVYLEPQLDITGLLSIGSRVL